jgi:hypothetical protein
LVQLRFQRGEISQISFQPLLLEQKGGQLALAYPDEEGVRHIGERLGWAELMESFP